MNYLSNKFYSAGTRRQHNLLGRQTCLNYIGNWRNDQHTSLFTFVQVIYAYGVIVQALGGILGSLEDIPSHTIFKNYFYCIFIKVALTVETLINACDHLCISKCLVKQNNSC